MRARKPGWWVVMILGKAWVWGSGGVPLLGGHPLGLVSGLAAQPSRPPLSHPLGDQGRGGDHMQVPRCVRLLHCADMLAAAGALPRGGQAPEAQV